MTDPSAPPPFDLNRVPIDIALWQDAIAATKTEASEEAGPPEKFTTWKELLADSYPGTMRANAIAIRHYLEHGMKIAPTTLRLSESLTLEHQEVIHHGDLHIDGSLDFNGNTCVVTGHVFVRDRVEGSAFSGTLMIGKNLECGAIRSDADIGIGGDLICRYARLDWYDCCWAARKIIAEVALDHGQTVHGEIEARLLVACDDHDTRLKPAHRALLETHLEPELFEEIYRDLDDDDDAESTAYARFDEIIGGRLLEKKPVFR